MDFLRKSVLFSLSLRATVFIRISTILEQATHHPTRHSHPQPFSRQREKGVALHKILPSFVKRERADA